ADCGIATRAAAQAAGLDFVPLAWERFDLALRQRDYFLPGLQALFKFVRTATFRERASELTGCDVSEAGNVRWVNWGVLFAPLPRVPRARSRFFPRPSSVILPAPQ